MIYNLFLSDEEKEQIDATIILAEMFGYETKEMSNGIHFTDREENKKIHLMVSEKYIKIRVINESSMRQEIARFPKTRMSLIKLLQKQLQ